MGAQVAVLQGLGDSCRSGEAVRLVAVRAHKAVVGPDHDHRAAVEAGQVLDEGAKAR